jgi:hypothetical protein
VNARGTLVWHSEFNANGRAGISLGGSPGSLYNRLQGNIVENNQRWGIVLALGSGHNGVAFNVVLGSRMDDLVDANPSCDASRWQHDRYRTPNQLCAT